jgi:hypothetical protein
MVATLHRWAALILVGGAIGLLTACAWHGAGVEGQVFEANSEAPMSQGTRLPSVGAYVIVHWTATLPQIAHASSTCLHAAIGKTDERGRFEVAGWWAAPKFYPVIPRNPDVMVYKAGFDQQPDSRNPGSPTARTLVRSKLTAEERVERLSTFAEAGCFDHETFKTLPLGDPHKISEDFYRALYEEAQALGPLPRASDHYLATLREKAGVPQPPEPPWHIRAIHPQGPRPAAPGPAYPGNPP